MNTVCESIPLPLQIPPIPPVPTGKSPIYDKIHLLGDQARQLHAEGSYFYMRALESANESHVWVRNREMLMFGSNNYLGLTTHPRVKEAAIRAVARYGAGAGSVRLLGGTFALHEELEERLARFKGTEAAVVYSSGYISNLATLSTVLSRQGDLALIDERIHASLVDGLRIARIPFRVFAHNDMADLEEKLARYAGRANPAIIVDGVYSMDGDIACLPAIHALAKCYSAFVIVDDAHATGVLGLRGKGTAEHFGLLGKIDLVMGTLSKALGAIGGFAAGSKDTVLALKHNARGFVFSGALPPAVCASLIASLDVLETDPVWLQRLRDNTRMLRDGLHQLGFNTGASLSPIIPVIVGEDAKAYGLTRFLNENDIFVSPVAYPAVRRGQSRIRISVMATHTPGDILRLLEVMQKAKIQLSLGDKLAA